MAMDELDQTFGLCFKTCKETTCRGTWKSFADALTVFINKPQVVNKKLSGSRILYQNYVEKTSIIHDVGLSMEVIRKTINEDTGLHQLEEIAPLSVTKNVGFILIGRLLVPKNPTGVIAQELIIIDLERRCAAFYPIKCFMQNTDIFCCANIFPYKLCYLERKENMNRIQIEVETKTLQNYKIADSDADCNTSGTGKVFTFGMKRSHSPDNKAKYLDSKNTSTDMKVTAFNSDSENQEKASISNKMKVTRIESNSSSQRDSSLDEEVECVSENDFNTEKDSRNSTGEGKTENKDFTNVTRGHTIVWMCDVLLNKLSNWSSQPHLKTAVTSLRLVALQRYAQVYGYLKDTYGRELVKVWPEKTDPQKFVYEDVAIAAYLIVLWEQERLQKSLERKQSFVDLGCGNGLLVYILTKEGHPGVGLDIRKRKIWEWYGTDIQLREQVVLPSAESTFPETDWLIGNHSDELTPWIPVMAARSHLNCRYFVLPCCHHDFNKKFHQKGFGESCYRSYLNFVQEVGKVCGFEVFEDTLRIPSTKRICFVGMTRKEEDSAIRDSRISSYIEGRTHDIEGEKDMQTKDIIMVENNCQTSSQVTKVQEQDQNITNAGQWTKNFRPREKIEKARNCKGVDRSIQDRIIHTVFNSLLHSTDGEVKKLPDGRTWRKGGKKQLSEVVLLFDSETLKAMKSECGGLQTLLRNYNSVFNVSGGSVQLRDLTLSDPYSKYSKLKKKDNSVYFKTIQCWFYNHHPDGCPRDSDTCTFAHGKIEERPRPTESQNRKH